MGLESDQIHAIRA